MMPLYKPHNQAQLNRPLPPQSSTTPVLMSYVKSSNKRRVKVSYLDSYVYSVASHCRVETSCKISRQFLVQGGLDPASCHRQSFRQ